MDRVNELRCTGGSGDSTLDTTSPPSEAYMSANESSSKYFSLSDSTFDLKDVSLASTTAEPDQSISEPDDLISNLSPIGKKDIMDSYKIGKQIEAANILSGGVDIFDDNDNSFDGDELVIDDNVEMDDKSNDKSEDQLKVEDVVQEATLVDPEVAIPSKDTEVVLQIDGRNVDAIDIGNGLYLYRKDGQEELAAVQIIDDGQQQPSFKFLKVRENAEGNLEVYEEIEIEIPKEVPEKEESSSIEKSSSHVPIKDINKVISDTSTAKVTDNKSPQKGPSTSTSDVESEAKDQADAKPEVNLNGKMMKFSESRKSPVVGSFTPMTYHSTPNKEGKPLTKTMVDLQLHPSRHSDNVKKTIEVHTDSNKQRPVESQSKKPNSDNTKKDNIECSTVQENVEITETIDKCKDKIDTPDKTITSDEKTDDLELKENKLTEENPETKEVIENKLEVSEVIEIKEDDVVNELVIDEDLESNEIGELVIDEKNDENQAIKEKEDTQTDEKKSEDLIDLPEALPILPENSPVVIDKATENKDKILQNQEKITNTEMMKSENDKFEEKLIVNVQNCETVDEIHTQESKKAVDISKIKSSEDSENKIDKSTAVVEIIKEISNKESAKPIISLDTKTEVLESKKGKNALESEIEKKDSDLEKKKTVLETVKEKTDLVSEKEKKALQSEKDKLDLESEKEQKALESKKEKNVFESEKETKSKVAKSEDTIQSTIRTTQPINEEKKPIVNNTIAVENIVPTKNETVTNIKPSNIVSNTKASGANTEENKLNVTKVMPNVKKVITQPNKKEENIVILPNDIIAKPVVNNSDIKIVPKNEIVSTSRQDITTIKETVADKKPSSSELSKTIELNKDQKEEVTFVKSGPEMKPINNNLNAVPFGKWTEVNRQEFLNKFKEHKAPAANTNSKQIKNSNDLNRRDVLKKIDSQRQSNIASTKDKPNVKNETIFSNKLPTANPDTKIPIKKDTIEVKPKLIEPVKTVTQPVKIITTTKPVKQELQQKKPVASSTVSSSTVTTKVTKKEPVQQKEISTAVTSVPKSESTSRREVNVNDLINKTIEDMLNKVVPAKFVSEDNKQQLEKKEQPANKESIAEPSKVNKKEAATEQIKILDDIEMKMNELHGIPFVERPPHELPKVQQSDLKAHSKSDNTDVQDKSLNKIDTESAKLVPENVIEVDSEEEVIEHEPITGDIEPNSKPIVQKLPPQDVNLSSKITSQGHNDSVKKETVITEKDFDKFARRNSITYDNCKTVNLEAKESQNIQNAKTKDIILSKNPKKEHFHLDPKSKLPLKQPLRPNPYTRKVMSNTEDSNNKHYQSKIHMAYQSVLISKMDRHPAERPITIIEDKPVKVVFMDSNADFVPGQLNVQGQELSPTKKQIVETSSLTATTDSLDSLPSEQTDDTKQTDDHKIKTKHQRKQVLTPVETPELELIQPSELGIDVSPKKKRKTEDAKNDKHYKNLVHKKSYLLGRSSVSEDKTNSDVSKISPRDSNNIENITTVNMNTTSALDNLVKAAELIENQSENIDNSLSPSTDSSQSTPIKRGRGRPRKYPLPETTPDVVKAPSPQKKPRLIDAKPVKDDSASEEDSSDGEIVQENWTMGKINENIVCPICNKLFRSENVVFKHVKHCTGVSPNRSESDKRSPRRDRRSQESDVKSFDSRSDIDIDTEEKETNMEKEVPKKRKSKESNAKSEVDKSEVIVIEDTPIKKKSDSNDDQRKEKKPNKNKVVSNSNSLVCEFCGKTFRQLSYLVNHKLQHKKDEVKKPEKDKESEPSSKPQVFSCEVCKKEFRKLHHLVQHRIIHNSTVPPRNVRKASSEQTDNKIVPKDEANSKQSDDPSAAFRCEPCDKSFRKLHHLVEHRETHDGINRQKITTPATTLEKPSPPPQCEVCKKTFRKLHHLIEHKEQHLETSSEKSDDKSVKSALSTKDIIHECSLCYMVFPNEHSLNKHSGICQKKKRQSKNTKNGEENADKNDENMEEDSKVIENEPKIIAEEIIDDDDDEVVSIALEQNKESQVNKPLSAEKSDIEAKDKTPQREYKEKVEQEHDKISVTEKPTQKENKEKESAPVLKESNTVVDNTKKTDDTNMKNQVHRKRIPIKDKVVPTVTKRRRTVETTMPTAHNTEVKPAIESSDDDEVRYMFNPKFNLDETNEGKVFMKVRANKRNSLQIERPNSKDLVKRRTSLQHHQKIPRLKAKPVEPKVVPPSHNTVKTVPKILEVETAASTDSDDSDVKYSFPKSVPEKLVKSVEEAAKKSGRKSTVDKRKTLSGIAKRKSLGQSAATKTKTKTTTPVKSVKKRTSSVEHRCDCGQLFSSAALLSRHTSLAHTPPRIRRRRSPPPPTSPLDSRPKAARKSGGTKPTTPPAQPAPRKSIRNEAPPTETRKSIKPEPKSTLKQRKPPSAHKGVPVPEKMRKLMQKNKK